MLKIAPENVASLSKYIDRASDIVIVSHTSPDGDAVGSCVGLASFLKSIGKSPCIILPNAFPTFLNNLDADGDIILYESHSDKADKAIAGADLIFCLDCSSFVRTDSMQQSLKGAKASKILIDHHTFPDTASFDLVFSELEISSTCELEYHILMATGNIEGDASRLPALTRQALFTGMTTDTNNFANSTYPSTLRMASALLESGVDREGLLNMLYNQFSEGRLRLIGHLLRDELHIVDGCFSYMLLSKQLQKEYGYTKGDVEGVVNRPLEIKDVLLSALFTEDDDFIRVSLRSKRGTAVNALASEYFNGGGHPNASGGRLYMKLEDVPAYFIESVREHLSKA